MNVISPALKHLKQKLPPITKKNINRKDGNIRAWMWPMFGRNWMIAKSDRKWHAGERFKRAPIWISEFKKGVPAIFIWNIAIGSTKPKLKDNTETDVSKIDHIT